MGKVQSKHGECFVVNAHFNPLCQVDEDSIYNKSNKDKSYACSELSFSLCEENSCIKSTTSPNERYPLQVVLPPEDNTPKMKKKFKEIEEKEESPEKAEEEKNEKEDTTEATCSVTVDDKEKQEFFFTLYDFDGHSKFSKEDVEKVVMRSICDALGKTLKLPPSGSRTIKVRLAVTPDNSTDNCTKEDNSDYENKTESDNKQTCHTLNSDYSANTNSTYLCTSNDERHTELHTRYHSPQLERIPSIIKNTSPAIKSRKTHRISSIQKQDGAEWPLEIGEKLCTENENKRHNHEGHETGVEEHKHHHRHRHQHRERITECRDRRNNYLDLAGTDNCNIRLHNGIYNNKCDGTFICPYHHLLDRNHLYSKLHKSKEMTEQIHLRTSLNEDSNNAHLYNNRSFAEQKTDLNLSSDMCNWERHRHRRSKSYDIYESTLNYPNILSSPKVKQRTGRCASLNPNGISPLSNHTVHSPTHHHQRHREREKEHQRAMQRVANWLEREHLGPGNHKDQMRHSTCLGHARRASQLVVEHHEHHHLHEHVHHHYHHYVES